MGKEMIERIDRECRTAEVGCVECKKIMGGNLIEFLMPIREKHGYYTAHPEEVRDIIRKGTAKASAVAQQTMEDVRSAMKI